jgi:hypothetical protein
VQTPQMTTLNRDVLQSPLSFNGHPGFQTPTAGIVGIDLNHQVKHTMKSTYQTMLLPV